MDEVGLASEKMGGRVGDACGVDGLNNVANLSISGSSALLWAGGRVTGDLGLGIALGVLGRGDGVCLKGTGTRGSNELSGSDILDRCLSSKLRSTYCCSPRVFFQFDGLGIREIDGN